MKGFEGISIEDVQGYWDARPCNSRHSLLSVDSVEYSQAVTARKFRVEPHLPVFASYSSWAGAKVLDVGCGIGTDSIRFAKAGAHVTAVDLSAESLTIARKRAVAESCIMDIRFYQADMEHLSRVVPVKPYDLIYSWGAVHHTPQPGMALAEFLRYAKSGTIFKLMLYHRNSTKAWRALWKTRGDRRLLTKEERIAVYSEAQTGCPVTWTYTRNRVRRMMTLLGLEIVDLHVDHIFPYSVPDYIEGRYVRALPWRHMSPWLFRTVEHWWGWHILVTAQLP